VNDTLAQAIEGGHYSRFPALISLALELKEPTGDIDASLELIPLNNESLGITLPDRFAGQWTRARSRAKLIDAFSWRSWECWDYLREGNGSMEPKKWNTQYETNKTSGPSGPLPCATGAGCAERCLRTRPFLWLSAEIPVVILLFLTAAGGFISGLLVALLIKGGAKSKQ
jgi:hypothetical protein